MVGDTVDSALELSLELAREAGALLMKNLGARLEMELKGEIDPVTELDRRVEKILVEKISERFPGHDFLAEEGTRPGGDSEWIWMIDPLDGTTNYAHGYPVFSVSLALKFKGVTRLGVVYQPATDEMFSAIEGSGAWLNGRRLKVSTQTELTNSFLVTGFPYNLRRQDVLKRNLRRFEKLLGKTFAIRRDGTAAYDLACVAAGRFDGYWEENLKPWDTSAGVLLVREAGGVVSSFDGAPFEDGVSPDLLAAGTTALRSVLEDALVLE